MFNQNNLCVCDSVCVIMLRQFRWFDELIFKHGLLKTNGRGSPDVGHSHVRWFLFLSFVTGWDPLHCPFLSFAWESLHRSNHCHPAKLPCLYGYLPKWWGHWARLNLLAGAPKYSAEFRHHHRSLLQYHPCRLAPGPEGGCLNYWPNLER